MAIGTNAKILFHGTQDEVTSTGGSTADAGFTSAGTWTNDDDAPMVSVSAELTYSVAPNTFGIVAVYAVPQDVNGSTSDPEDPQTDLEHFWIGNFKLNDVTSAQFPAFGPVMLPASFASSQVYEFWIKNLGGQTLSANWHLWVTPMTTGPHP